MKLDTHQPLLKFREGHADLSESLSAVVRAGDDLWVASDESTGIERVSTNDGLTFQNHRSFPLDDIINLPAKGTAFDQEIDIEGLDIHDSHLWLVGSHSIKRKNVKSDEEGKDAKLIEKLSKVEAGGNRFILAQIPLLRNAETGEQELCSPGKVSPGSGQILCAAQLPGDVKSNALTDALRQAEGNKGDSHLARFLDVPGKDNGFDIEGLAVAGREGLEDKDEKVFQIFIGLRGPVLRGWAIVLELCVKTTDHSRLKLKNFGPDGQPYRKHFLNLDGLGVRDLCVDGEDLLILAGPTMKLDGPTLLYRWRGATVAADETLVRGERLVRLLEIPFGHETDHAEGFTIIDGAEPRRILVVYDSPGSERKGGPGEVRADVFELPGG